jgi:dihydrodiol dehydrogenase / D-xylose 1-dehydrogenase (NADP)
MTESEAKPLRWGIASTGVISFDFANALSTELPTEHEIVAVAARNEQNAKEFAKKFSIPKFYGGYENMMHDPEVGRIFKNIKKSNYYKLIEFSKISFILDQLSAPILRLL